MKFIRYPISIKGHPIKFIACLLSCLALFLRGAVGLKGDRVPGLRGIMPGRGQTAGTRGRPFRHQGDSPAGGDFIKNKEVVARTFASGGQEPLI